MSEPDLRELENEVAAARARLAHDLSVLRSPRTFASFKEDLTHEAVSMKDALVGKARTEATSRVSELVDDIKARAAANPAAVLAIGAGIAWRLLRHPPITTALIGAGLISLLRTSPGPHTHQSDAAYLERAKRRLNEQASEAASAVGAQASSIAASASDKMHAWNAEIGEQASALAARAGETVQQWNAEATARLHETQARVQATAAELMDAAKARAAQLSRDTSDEVRQRSDRMRAGAEHASDAVSARWRSARETAIRSSPDIGGMSAAVRDSFAQGAVTDKLLLGAAGLAVATALGIACQRRIGAMESAD
jgi:hypothetical protein